MGSSYRGLRLVASFRPYTSKQVGDTGPAESARRSNSRAFRSSFSGASGTPVLRRHLGFCVFIVPSSMDTSNEDDVIVYSRLFPTRGFVLLRREYMRDLEESCQHSHGKNKKKNKKKKKRATSSSSESEDRKSRARRKNRRSGDALSNICGLGNRLENDGVIGRKINFYFLQNV